jgi:hypothetical protein
VLTGDVLAGCAVTVICSAGCAKAGHGNPTHPSSTAVSMGVRKADAIVRLVTCGQQAVNSFSDSVT